MKYAVLEWDTGNDTEETRVIATNQTIDTAQMLVKISPNYYTRSVISMSELRELRKADKEE